MCRSIAKCLLTFTNVLFTVVSVTIISGGIILAFIPSSILESAYQQVKAATESEHYSIPESVQDLKNIPLVHDIGIALFVFGIFLFPVSLLGWCGACCTSCCRCMLILFAVIVIILMLAEITVGALICSVNSPLHTAMKTELKDKIKLEYNEEGKDAFSTVLNLIHKHFECCGIDGGQDFYGRSHRSCAPIDEYTGCYKKLTDVIVKNKLWAGLGLAVTLMVQLMQITLAVIIYTTEDKAGLV